MKYVIIGGGPCGDSAIKEIRKNDKESEITLISEEAFPPYRRLSLTKQAWTMAFDKISLKTEGQNINFVPNTKAIDLDHENKKVICSNGKNYEYDKLLIATGISPRKLSYEGLVYLRTYSDLENLKSKLVNAKDLLVIGAGFTGLELGAQLKEQGYNVSIINPDDLPCKRFLPIEFCKEINDSFINNGIKFINDGKYNIEKVGDKFKVTFSNGDVIEYDLVIASIGNIPNIPFGDKLSVENGIVVNEFMETSIDSVYAAGDVAQYESSLFGYKMRREFMDSAMKGGKCAAQNMLGIKTSYDPILNTFFDAFDLSYKAVGEYAMNMDVTFKEVQGGSVIFYKKDNEIKGVLFWKVKPALAVASKLIEDRLTLSDEEYFYMMKMAL